MDVVLGAPVYNKDASMESFPVMPIDSSKKLPVGSGPCMKQSDQETPNTNQWAASGGTQIAF